MEKVSIIVPVYNMETFIDQGLSCLCRQTYQNLEIIIIDDGSQDNGPARLQQFAKKDSRIQIYHQKNSGPGAARNLGIKHATGVYAYFFDVDDTLVPDAIEKLVSAMEYQNTDLVVCGFELFDGETITKTVPKADNLLLTGDQARQDYYRHCFIYETYGIQGGACYKLYRLDLIRRFSVAFPDIRRSEDDVFVARYVSHIRSVYFIKDILCRFYFNNNKRFRDKYPFDTFESARVSTMSMLDIIYTGWNPQNIQVRNKLYYDYYQKTFLSLWFLFSPKLKLTPRKRYHRLKQIVDTFIADIPCEDFGVSYAVLSYMRKKQYLKLYVRMLYYTIKHWND